MIAIGEDVIHLFTNILIILQLASLIFDVLILVGIFCNNVNILNRGRVGIQIVSVIAFFVTILSIILLVNDEVLNFTVYIIWFIVLFY